MMENENCPGWLYEVTCGATTFWEGWDAIEPDSGRLKPLSQNHYAPGAVVAWLFSRCAGIRAGAPGFEKVQIRPIPGGTLTWAEACYESVRGEIRVRWERKGRTFLLDVTVPEEVEATVILPDGARIDDAKSGRYQCLLC